MKLKRFRDLLKKRFTQEEIALIEQRVDQQLEAVRSLQKTIKQTDN